MVTASAAAAGAGVSLETESKSYIWIVLVAVWVKHEILDSRISNHMPLSSNIVSIVGHCKILVEIYVHQESIVCPGPKLQGTVPLQVSLSTVTPGDRRRRPLHRPVTAHHSQRLGVHVFL